MGTADRPATPLPGARPWLPTPGPAQRPSVGPRVWPGSPLPPLLALCLPWEDQDEREGGGQLPGLCPSSQALLQRLLLSPKKRKVASGSFSEASASHRSEFGATQDPGFPTLAWAPLPAPSPCPHPAPIISASPLAPPSTRGQCHRFPPSPAPTAIWAPRALSVLPPTPSVTPGPVRVPPGASPTASPLRAGRGARCSQGQAGADGTSQESRPSSPGPALAALSPAGDGSQRSRARILQGLMRGFPGLAGAGGAQPLGAHGGWSAHGNSGRSSHLSGPLSPKADIGRLPAWDLSLSQPLSHGAAPMLARATWPDPPPAATAERPPHRPHCCQTCQGVDWVGVNMVSWTRPGSSGHDPCPHYRPGVKGAKSVPQEEHSRPSCGPRAGQAHRDLHPPRPLACDPGRWAQRSHTGNRGPASPEPTLPTPQTPPAWAKAQLCHRSTPAVGTPKPPETRHPVVGCVGRQDSPQGHACDVPLGALHPIQPEHRQGTSHGGQGYRGLSLLGQGSPQADELSLRTSLWFAHGSWRPSLPGPTGEGVGDMQQARGSGRLSNISHSAEDVPRPGQQGSTTRLPEHKPRRPVPDPLL
ncbi:basic proline-rich protein-like [Choloepus didactylus]|uniref:basic proline-rich protein-like n=1 Tax=Choloepus didactylus TaxID=27675 RepID=UPI00189D4DB9|nr:basic proline-rich protein-like [Choloepus didactylus]